MAKRIRSADDASAGRYTTAEERFAVLLGATMRTTDGACDVRIRNISAGGLMAVSAAPPHPGTLVTIAARDKPVVAGRVAWARGESFGVMFDDRIDIEAFMGWHHEAAAPQPTVAASA